MAFADFLGRRISKAGRGVVASAEFRRIQALPAREDLSVFVRDFLADLKRPLSKGKYATLRPDQYRALADIFWGGLVGLMGVGSGKTLVSVLAASVAACDRPLLVVPASLVDRTKNEIVEINRAWRTHPGLTVVSWSFLSLAKNKDFLIGYKPDLLVLDEAHALKNRRSARTRRIEAYLKNNPDCRVIPLSGTMMRKSVADCAHVFGYALCDGSPLPRTFSDVEDWAMATDEDPLVRMAPGALTRIMRSGETPRQAVWRKVRETKGVVTASVVSEELPSLTIRAVDVRAKPAMLGALKMLESLWMLPDGVMLTDPLAVWRHARELSSGFFLEWEWSPEVSETDKERWISTRAEWSKFVRDACKSTKYDSELLVKRACETDKLPREIFDRWTAVSAGIKKPKTVPSWSPGFDDVTRITGNFLNNNERCLVWTETPAIGTRLSAELGVPYLGAGSTEADVLGTERAIVSVTVCGVGMNLQKFSENLVLQPPASGQAWEQLIGRTHRPGQKADEVSFDVLAWTPPLIGAWEAAVKNAEYLEHATGNPQKLLYATKTGF